MSNRSKYTKMWRYNTKKRIVKAMGGKCCICGYNKCIRSLDLHHLHPSQKKFGIGQIMSDPISWKKMVSEIRKCVLLCSNCHGEYHDGLINIPKNATKFNEKYADKNVIKWEVEGWNRCPECNKMKPPYRRTCSTKCAAKLARKVDWSKYDIERMRRQGKSFEEIASFIGISGHAVIKRLRRIKQLKNNKRTCAYKICKNEFRYKRANQKYCSEKCSRMASRKAERPTKKQLAQDIANYTWLAIGKKYGVSDNAIRKWARKYGLIV